MIKYLIAALVAMTVALGGALYWARHEAQTAASATLQAQAYKTQAEAAQARLGAVQKQVQAQQSKLESAQQELRNVLKQNQAWSDGAVPPDVARSLCQYVPCAAPPAAGSVR